MILKALNVKLKNVKCCTGATGNVKLSASGDRECDYAVEILQQEKYIRMFNYNFSTGKLEPTTAFFLWPGMSHDIPTTDSCKIRGTCDADTKYKADIGESLQGFNAWLVLNTN